MEDREREGKKGRKKERKKEREREGESIVEWRGRSRSRRNGEGFSAFVKRKGIVERVLVIVVR